MAIPLALLFSWLISECHSDLPAPFCQLNHQKSSPDSVSFQTNIVSGPMAASLQALSHCPADDFRPSTKQSSLVV